MSRMGNSTGRLLLTKNVGTYDPVDITASYKVIKLPEPQPEPEGSPATTVESRPKRVINFNFNFTISRLLKFSFCFD